MATVAENLQSLNEAKQAIKTAIENKGQDLSGVPFTEYASKIEAIESGGGYSVADLILSKISKNGKKRIEGLFRDDTRLTGDMLTKILNDAGNPHFDGGCIGAFENCIELDYVPYMNVSGSAIHSMFMDCGKLKTVIGLDTTGTASAYNLFNNCVELENVPLIDISNVANCKHVFFNCTKLKVIPALDIRSATDLAYFSINTTNITEIWIKNINANYQCGKGTSYGHLLTQESALHLCKECRKSIKDARTITFATPVYNNLETLYVKLIPITDEMRAEDDLIDEKYPFEVCESTDEGAKTMAMYMLSKNWSIAK